MNESISELLEICEYDDRDPDMNWHGHIGHSNLDGDAIVLYRSWASPREGCNAEKIVVEMARNRVQMIGFSDVGRELDHRFQAGVSFNKVVGLMLIAAKNGYKSPTFLFLAAKFWAMDSFDRDASCYVGEGEDWLLSLKADVHRLEQVIK